MKLRLTLMALTAVLNFAQSAQGACSLARPGDCFGGGGSLKNPTAEQVEASFIVSPRWYADTYPDLKQAFGYDTKALLNHWANNGRYEGRRPSPGFDPAYYLNANPDLKAAFGDDLPSASRHWSAYGRKECRQGAPEFNPVNYLNRYADLKAAFGNNCEEAYRHYLEYGFYEGRDAR